MYNYTREENFTLRVFFLPNYFANDSKIAIFVVR